jgi:hypothetical protein
MAFTVKKNCLTQTAIASAPANESIGRQCQQQQNIPIPLVGKEFGRIIRPQKIEQFSFGS